MTNDDRDPIAAAFADYQRAPADIVPRAPMSLDDELAGLAALDSITGETATVTHIEPDGVTSERITITTPVYPKGTH